MANKNPGCLGCLGSLVIFSFIGSMFFGGGVLMRVAGLQFSFGNPVNQQQFIASYLNDLEDKQKIAAEAVQKFHTQLTGEKCEEIYEQANEILKGQQSQAAVVGLCANIQRNFGSVESTQQVDWWGQPANREADKYILVRYETKFSKATTQETFIWLVKNDKAELVSYQIIPSNVIPSNIEQNAI